MITIEEDCTTGDLAKKLKGYRPSDGRGFFEFVEPEHISPFAEVLLMNKVSWQ